MRRQKKCNVYTNRTIKRCPYQAFYCDYCRSYCKPYYLNKEDPATISSAHDYYTNKKLHQMGVGSLLPGKTFIPIMQKHTYDDYSYRHDIIRRKIQRKRLILEELALDVSLNDFMRSVDLLFSHS